MKYTISSWHHTCKQTLPLVLSPLTIQNPEFSTLTDVSKLAAMCIVVAFLRCLSETGMLHSQEGVQYGHMNHLEQIKLSTCVGTKITR